MPTCRSNDVDLYYETRGEGPPLLLVAGIASDSASWLPVMNHLARDFRVIALDNRGVGRTVPMEAPTSIAAMADDCAALLSHLGLPRASVVGHSMGGFIAQELALRHPARVDRLVLAATSSRVSSRNRDLFATWCDALEHGEAPVCWFRNLFHWLFSPAFFDRPEMVDSLVRFAVEYPYPQTVSALRRQVGAIAAFDSSAALARIGARTLVVAGGQDLVFPARECAALAAAIPGAAFTLIDEAAHSIHFEHPVEFHRRVAAFLAAP